ncbi:DUF1800 domain-containing protein [Paraburkholderia phenoliruptrix]|uniref:DUF1800 domain-containing protein n=1 Tax=Paraburkholderia phenoliruptrix TaxID=252970 RepID=UPI001C6E40D3|nr:DUF1800 domain-containing protein [Paraburkholderia phenoliruptrix]MBW9102453.1 DUF1800 domain-containing protein [Paraburkholderia phenoliruptrix]MBW9127674.1 DUF1800 domain-containing protein [Paraburkholderia ginsengiterrae]
MAVSPNLTPAAIALNRFGLGARADDTPPAAPKAWLLAQLEQYEPRPAAWADQPDSLALSSELEQQRLQLREQRQRKPGDAGGASMVDTQVNTQANTQSEQTAASQSTAKQAKDAERKAMHVEIRDRYRCAVNARVTSALTTPTPFVERLVHFWANHFAVSTEKPAVAALAGSFEAEAIRPHVLGRFEDMLVAVERHPAMQVFLDQTRSVGPDSMAALRAGARNPQSRRGLNENLAREIMELHTLGVRSGYSQSDVTEFAQALTGWSVANTPVGAGTSRMLGTAPAPGTFAFREALHEPGVRTVMGRRYDQRGEEQALAILHDLATAPATAQHIGGKLARHFIADTPPAGASEKLADAFQTSGGDLPTVYRALLDLHQAWSPTAVKFKTPWEWAISSMRGLGWQDLGKLQAAPLFAQLGQPVWRPGSPSGYDDVAASWAAPDALVRRVEVAQRFAARVGDRLDARSLGEVLLPGSLGAPTTVAIARAESASTAIALLLVSPDFQRR